MGVKLAAYKEQIRRLLPRGKAWEGPHFVRLVEALANEIERIAATAENLTLEAIPRTTDELLTDYEWLVGLPFPGFSLAVTEAARRIDVVSKLIAQGGQSSAYYIAIAESRGHTATVVEDGIMPFRVGINHAGDRLYGVEWVFFWILRVADAGPDLQLEYLNERYKPAHTIAAVEYGS